MKREHPSRKAARRIVRRVFGLLLALASAAAANGGLAVAQQCDARPPVGTGGGPGGDNPDDTVSHTRLGSTFQSSPPALSLGASSVAVLERGFVDQAVATLARVGVFALTTDPDGLSDPAMPTTMVLPSGSLAGTALVDQLSSQLAQYVERGGTLVVFAQQRWTDFAVLPTSDAAPIGAWGWHEDNSCYANGAYIDTFHPILASQSSALVTSNVDGYFDSIPANAIVLLRRVKNAQPAMFMYPYGQGWVIVSASYDDWGGFNQTGPGARAIIRDAIAWAKKPADLPIHAPGSTASVTLTLRNESASAASQAKLLLMSPSRDRLIREEIVGVSVDPGQAASVPFSHTFASNSELGIYHVDYELLDDQGEAVQPVSEDDDGRIVIARPPTNPYRPQDLLSSVVMPGGEDVFAGEPATFRHRLTNRGTTARTLRLYTEFNHTPAQFQGEVVVGPGQTVEHDLNILVPGWASAHRFWLHIFEPGGTPYPRVFGVATPPETGAYQLSDSKGLRAYRRRASIEVVPDRPFYTRGDAATFTLTIRNETPLPWNGTTRIVSGGEGSGTPSAVYPISLAANGSVTIPVPLTIGTPASYHFISYVALAEAGSVVVGSGAVGLRVYDPEVRGLEPPTVSGPPGSLSVSWPIENVRPVNLVSGTALAELRSRLGEILWQDQQGLALGASPSGQGQMRFTLPPIPADINGGFLRLSALNAFGKGVVSQVPLDRKLSGTVETTIPEFAAGQSGEVILRLRNDGNVPEGGMLGGSVDRLGSLAEQPFSLVAGETATLRYPLTIPSSAAGGPHAGRFDAVTGPIPFSVSVQRARFEFEAGEGPVTAGQSLPVTLHNTGGSAATPAVNVELEGVVSRGETVTLAPGQQVSLDLVVPDQTASGPYLLEATASDPANGVGRLFSRTLQVAGVSATLTLSTDRETYVPGATVQVAAQATNGVMTLSGGELHLAITNCEPDIIGGRPGLPGSFTEDPDEDCFSATFWERTVPLNLGPGQAHAFAETTPAVQIPGGYILLGVVRNAAGAVLAEGRRLFQVIEGEVGVSVSAPKATYHPSSGMIPLTGRVENFSSAPEPGLMLTLSVEGDTLLEESFALAAGASRDFSVPFDPSGFGGAQRLVSARVRRGNVQVASSDYPLTIASPGLSAGLAIPDPESRLATSSSGLVAAEEGDLDAVTKTDAGELVGTLPFDAIANWGVARFRQSVDGFVELFGDIPSGATGACLDQLAPHGIFLAPALGDLDASLSGYVGHKYYAAGSADRAGRVFTEDTLVFFWDAPESGATQHNRFQVLLTRSGLARLDAGALFVAPTPTCSTTGATFFGQILALQPEVPFGLRVEAGVARGAVRGVVRLDNLSDQPGTLTVAYGRTGDPPRTETVSLDAAESRRLPLEETLAGPTSFTLQVTGDVQQTQQIEVAPGAQSVVVLSTGPAGLEPGEVGLPVAVGVTGMFAASLDVSFDLSGPGGAQTLTRHYELEPGASASDVLPFVMIEGDYTLTASSSLPVTSTPISLRAAPAQRVSFAAVAAAPAGGTLPIGIDLANTGLGDFAGEVQVEGPAGQAAPVELGAGASSHLDLSVNLAAVEPGPHTFQVRLVSAAGTVLASTAVQAQVLGPRVALMDSPEGEAFDAGAVAALRFRLRNTGDQEAAGIFRFAVFDEERSADYLLAPGGETEVVLEILLADETEEKAYPGRYTIETTGSPVAQGQVSFLVRGISLAVDAALDQESYADGDTASFTVNVTNNRPTLGTDYLVRVHYGAFEETRPLSVAGTAATTFNVPLPTVTGEPLFLGISHPDGRSLYINTYHVRRADDLATVSVDQQVYAPGTAVTITATAVASGTLRLDGPGYSESITLSGSITRSFTLPTDQPGGTYFVTWTLATNDGRSAAGSVPFDVSGVRVRVFRAELDRGRYETGDTIESTLQIHTSHSTSAVLRGFIVDPDGIDTLAGEATISLDAAEDLLAVHSWPFVSVTAGLHRFVYGIYQPGGTLLASGSVAFDVGHAAVLGVRTDKTEYPLPDETVRATVSAFVSGAAALRLEVDGQPVATPAVSGSGIIEIVSDVTGIGPGDHELVAVMEGGGYVSRRSTRFALGSTLPDLSPGAPILSLTSSAGSIVVPVSNVGRSASGPADVVVRKAGTVLATGSVPALAAGSSAVVSLSWNVQGQAGSHEVEAVVDSGNAVVEFREDNNAASATVDVPAIVVRPVADASYPANVEADLSAIVSNLTADTTLTQLTLNAAVVRPDATEAQLSPVSIGTLPPGAAVSLATPWAVGRSAPGVYAVRSRIENATGGTVATASAAFDVLATPSFTGTVSASPNPAGAGGPVTFAGRIDNQGNVSAEGQARFDLVAPGGLIAARTRTPASVPLGGSANVSATIDPLDVMPGEYGLDLRMEVGSQEYPVASGSLPVTGAAVTASLVPDGTPRVLVYVGGSIQDVAGRTRRTQFVQASLAGTGAFHRTTSDPLEFAKQVRSGLWNVHVVMTDVPLLLPLLADELREAAYRGDGVVLVQWRPGTTLSLEEALGVRVLNNQPGVAHTLSILNGPFGNPQTVAVPGPAARLTMTRATLQGTLEGNAPALSSYGFGHGRSAALSFDPGVASSHPSSAALRALFARIVAYVAPTQARTHAPGTIVPLAVAVENPGPNAQAVDVSVSWPLAVRLGGVDDSPTTPAIPTWVRTLAAGESRLFRFQVVVPDLAGAFPINAQVSVGGVPLASQPALTIAVARTTAETLADEIAALEATTVAPGDQLHLLQAITALRAAQLTGSDPIGLESRIRLAAEAAAASGRIQSVSLDETRRTLGHLMAAWERSWYEWAAGLAPAWGSHELSGEADLQPSLAFGKRARSSDLIAAR